MEIGKGLIRLKTKVVPEHGCFLILKSGADRIELRISQADLEVFEDTYLQKDRKIKELEKELACIKHDWYPPTPELAKWYRKQLQEKK